MDRKGELWMLMIAFLVAAPGCVLRPHSTRAIEGTWAIASASLGGRELPLAVFNNSPLLLAGGKYAFQNDTGEYSVSRASGPEAIDVRGLRGPNAGRTIPAIFKLHADTLTICYDLSLKARPKDFSSVAGTQLFLVRYTRRS